MEQYQTFVVLDKEFEERWKNTPSSVKESVLNILSENVSETIHKIKEEQYKDKI